MISSSKDLLINWKKTPDEDSREFSDFWANERRKCKEGIKIDGVYINPFLYWHCNLWTIVTDHITKGRIRAKPSFRDSEWLLTNKIWEAETWKNSEGQIRKKGMVAAGCRRFSKSVLEASFCAWKACNWRNSQIVISGASEPDIKIVTDMVDLGINELPNYYVKTKVEDNWKKQVSLGYKDAKTNQRNVWSTFAIRNFDSGINEEALAGLTPDGGIIDEGGKAPFLKALLAGLPGLSTPNGWRGSFLVLGTGGDMNNFQDFKELFENPDKYNFLSCELPEENKFCGVFLPGWMSYAYPKEEKTFAEHLGLDPATHPNLQKIPILAADKGKNEKLIDEERDKLKKSSDTSALRKHTMYFPKTTQEIFLTDSNNNFPIEACLAQKNYLLENYQPLCVDFYRDLTNKVHYRLSPNRPINKYPIETAETQNFGQPPVVLYESEPEKDVPYGTYVIGVDPVNEDSSSHKLASLGAIYVYKRMFNPMGKNQNMIVAGWAGRCKTVREFHELCLQIAEFYNAIGSVLPENEDKSLIQYFIMKNKAHYLADSFELSKQINPLTKTNRSKGLSAATPNQRYGMNLLVAETKEPYLVVQDDGEEVEMMGVNRIPDPMLLEEMIQYRGKEGNSKGVHDINCDRIVAAYHALILARYFDNLYKNDQWRPTETSTPSLRRPAPKVLTGFFGSIGGKSYRPKGFGFV